MTTITVFGGTGFLGRRLVQRLVAEGVSVRVAVRHADPARRVLRAAGLSQVTVFRADLRERASVAAAVSGADGVVNAVSAYVEKQGVTFEAMHKEGAETVAKEAVSAGAARLVLVSGIGADPGSKSPYIRARGRGELAVRQAFPGATIVRPSAMFGPGDALFGRFAQLARIVPVLPLIGGDTRLQPAYVEDVAEAITRMLTDPAAAGRTYELAGPRIYKMRELVETTLHLIVKRRLLMPVPLAAATILARLSELLPSPPLTVSEVDLLKTDNMASGLLPGFRELGIEPKGIEAILPTYIGKPHMSEPH